MPQVLGLDQTALLTNFSAVGDPKRPLSEESLWQGLQSILLASNGDLICIKACKSLAPQVLAGGVISQGMIRWPISQNMRQLPYLGVQYCCAVQPARPVSRRYSSPIQITQRQILCQKQRSVIKTNQKVIASAAAAVCLFRRTPARTSLGILALTVGAPFGERRRITWRVSLVGFDYRMLLYEWASVAKAWG